MKWYGYRLKTGELKLRPLSENTTMATAEIREAAESSIVAQVFGPFIADTQPAAMKELVSLSVEVKP